MGEKGNRGKKPFSPRAGLRELGKCGTRGELVGCCGSARTVETTSLAQKSLLLNRAAKGREKEIDRRTLKNSSVSGRVIEEVWRRCLRSALFYSVIPESK